MRRRALELLDRTDDDLTDSELFSRQATGDFWMIDLALTTLHKLPSEVEYTMLCSEYVTLQAYNVVKSAMADMQRRFPGNA